MYWKYRTGAPRRRDAGPEVGSSLVYSWGVANLHYSAATRIKIIGPSGVVGWGSVMGLDTGSVFKRPILCPHCNEDYLFTLRAIADNPELRCCGCGNSIRLGDSVYEPLVSDVRTTLEAIDSAPPSFISARPRLFAMAIPSLNFTCIFARGEWRSSAE